MNLPNSLTILRIFFVPLLVAALVQENFSIQVGGVLITNDYFDLRMGIGAALALLGVLIVALRPNHVMPLLMAIRNRAQ